MVRMANNGSAVVPSFRYKDAHAAIAWFELVLGFARHAVYEGAGGVIDHAELTLGNGMIMLGSADRPSPHAEHMAHPDEIGGRNTSPTYVVVPDCGAVYERAQAAGARILSPLKVMDYGGGAFTMLDPEGYVWSVGEYDPWAATAASK